MPCSGSDNVGTADYVHQQLVRRWAYRPADLDAAAALAARLSAGTTCAEVQAEGWSVLRSLFSDVPEPVTGRAVVERVNHVRRQHGLPAVRYSLSLSRGSRRWSRHLHKVGYLVHADGLRGRWKQRGEVLSQGFADPVQAWLDSPPHRAIVLGTWPKLAGAGRSGNVWCARFGAR